MTSSTSCWAGRIDLGQDWYSYGWEIQLLETGFLAIFLCPLLDWRPFARRPAPRLVVWLFRWLAFRIMFGAGLIKIRGDPCWRDLTCLYYVCAASRSKRGLVEAHAPSPLAAAAVV